MKDRIEAVLPTLIEEPGLSGAGIVDEAILIGVAIAFDPGHRSIERRPDLVD